MPEVAGFFVVVVGSVHRVGVVPTSQPGDGFGIVGFPDHHGSDDDQNDSEQKPDNRNRDQHLDQGDATLFLGEVHCMFEESPSPAVRMDSVT